jgi:hypothetical protein
VHRVLRGIDENNNSSLSSIGSQPSLVLPIQDVAWIVQRCFTTKENVKVIASALVNLPRCSPTASDALTAQSLCHILEHTFMRLILCTSKAEMI